MYLKIYSMKFPVFLFLLFISALPAAGQITRPSRPIENKQQDDRLDKVKQNTARPNRREILHKLDLTRAQQLRLKQIRDEHKARKEAIGNDPQLNDEQKQQQLKDLQKQLASQFRSVLTEEQKKKFLELTRESRAGDKDGL